MDGLNKSTVAKRFTDTDKWKKPFVRALEAPYKLLWLYILDDCDMAGIWQVDFEVARIRTGQELNYESALRLFGDRIKPIDKFKWFIPDFITFQYGNLSENNRMHVSVIQILKKYNLYLSPLQGATEGAKDKDKDKDKVMVKEEDKDKYIVVDSKKILDPIEILEFYQAQLNTMMREVKTDWRTQVPIWFEQHIKENFKDAQHVKNSFKRFYMDLKPNGYNQPKEKISVESILNKK